MNLEAHSGGRTIHVRADVHQRFLALAERINWTPADLLELVTDHLTWLFPAPHSLRLPLSRHQQEGLWAIVDLTVRAMRMPTFRRLADFLGHKSPNAVLDLLCRLQAKGYATHSAEEGWRVTP